jgi:hypothetical protein
VVLYHVSLNLPYNSFSQITQAFLKFLAILSFFSFFVHQLQSSIMKFSLALLSSVLLATSTLAAPQPERGLARRLQRRGRILQGSTKLAKDSKNSKTKFNAATGNTSDVEYSQNWSGMAITSPPTGETFNAVSAQFTVPTPSAPSGVDSTDGEYAASAVRNLFLLSQIPYFPKKDKLIRCSGLE